MKAIIVAAGHGTRMLPITKTIPKELLPVGDKPVMQYIVEGLVDAGVENQLIVTSQSKAALEDYFDKNYELEAILEKKGKKDLLEKINAPKMMANYTFVKQSEQLGTGHAVAITEPWMGGNDFFLVVFGDSIYHPEVFKGMIAKYKETGCPIMHTLEVPMEEVTKYGIMKLDGEKIVDIVEKPTVEEAPSNLIWTGAALLPKEIFALLKDVKPDAKSGEIYLPEAVKMLMKQYDILPFTTGQYTWWDIGNPESWLQANIEIVREGRMEQAKIGG